MQDQYETLAVFYDILIPDPPGMLEFYRELVRGQPRRNPVLEIGAGTGRLSLLLAASDIYVTAADASRAMIDVLKAKRERLAGPGKARLETVIADQTTLKLARRYATVLITGGTLQHCLTRPAYDAALAAARAHCEDGAMLALDIARMPDSTARTSFRRDYGSYSGARLTPRWQHIKSWDDVIYDATSDVTETRSFFEMRDGDGLATERFQYTFRQTFPCQDELRSMVEQAGFSVLDIHGGFRQEAVGPSTDQFVLTARAR